MVTVTVYLEGGTNPNELNADALASSNVSVYREEFESLLTQALDTSEISLIVESKGPISAVKAEYARVKAEGTSAVFLIDLDDRAVEIPRRLADNFQNEPAAGIVFFMVQKMESWILSQPWIIDELAREENWQRDKKYPDTVAVADSNLLKVAHPENIKNADTALNTICTRYFKKYEARRKKQVNVRYGKTKHGPRLIGLLDLELLCGTFSEADRLVKYLRSLS